MGDWTGDSISGINTINAVLREYDMGRLEDLRTYRLKLLKRIKQETGKDESFLYLGGRGGLIRHKSKVPMNAKPRTETGDVAKPKPHAFVTLKVYTPEYVASTGLTQWEIEMAVKSEAGVIDLIDTKLGDIKDDMDWRLNNAARGDGTGRLAKISGVGAGSLTVNNTAANFGWDGASLMLVGQEIDVYTPADGTGTWTTKLIGATVETITDNGNGTWTVTYSGGTASNGGPAASDVVFGAGAVELDGTNKRKNWLELNGLLHICDDGLSNFTSGGPGSYQGTDYLGIDRTQYSTLQAKVVDNFSGGNPASWDIDDIQAVIAEINNGYGGGKVTAIYGNDKIIAALARKARSANAYRDSIQDGKVTGGVYTEEIRTNDGETVPLVVMPELPDHTLFPVNERDFTWLTPRKPTFINPYSGDHGGNGKDVFFGAPAQRDLTYEAWLRTVCQLVAHRCDNCARIQGLRDDE